MSKMVLNFEEKNHVLEVDGVEYTVPQRTQEILDKLAKHDEKVNKVNEFESNIEVLTILFGEDAVSQMFPEKEKTNLDKLAKCVKYALALFYTEYHNIQRENVKEKLKDLDPIIKSVDKLTNAVSTMQTADFVAKRHK